MKVYSLSIHIKNTFFTKYIYLKNMNTKSFQVFLSCCPYEVVLLSRYISRIGKLFF